MSRWASKYIRSPRQKICAGLTYAETPPKGFENNWLQTIPGKSLFVILRMYGPLKPFLDKSWRPRGIELVK